MKNRLLLFTATLLLVLGGCANNETAGSDDVSSDQLQVYTTVYPLQYFTERIGGEFVDVKSIYPPGTDEHMFEPTQQDMISLAKGDLFLYIGLGLEGFVDKTKKTLQNEEMRFVAIADAIDPEELEEGHVHEEDEHEHGHDEAVDPHVWISPKLSAKLAEEITQQLSEELPEHAAEFKANSDVLTNELDELDLQYATMADAAPNKTFFVSHAAFGYLAHAYGLQQLAVSGLDSQNEPSQKELAALVKEAQEKDIQYILFEQNVSSKLADVIKKELNAETLTLHNLSVLTDEDIANEETYFTLMEHNLEVLEKALSN